MTKFIAKAGLHTAQVAIVFCNYWYTFGLWPKSWLSFFLCTTAAIMLIALGLVVDHESK